MKSTTFVCTRCGREHPLEEQVWVGDEIICEDCSLDYTSVCERCGTRVWDEESICDGYITLCDRCFEEDYTRCNECERIILADEACYDANNDPYCDSCWDALHKSPEIHDYCYKPTPIFYGEGSRYFGVELEIDGADRAREAAERILDIANVEDEHLYIKMDGSLERGMELVTHPMTLDYHMGSMPWDKILSEAKAFGYRSHQTTTCGLHVHISRKAFGETELNQECAIARLLYFVEKFWTELLRFSRRTQCQINRWAARYGMKLSPQEVMDYAKDSCAGRYTAVNLRNCKTIEIRIFRGTLKLNTLLATLQMVNAICDVAILLSDEELQMLSWHDFLDRIHEPELIQYLKERDLYKNEPVCSEEDE